MDSGLRIRVKGFGLRGSRLAVAFPLLVILRQTPEALNPILAQS